MGGGKFISKFTVKGVGRETERKNTRCNCHLKLIPGEYLCELGLHKDLLDRPQKRKNWKRRKIKQSTSETTNLCYSKDTIKKMKGQARDWEKIVAKYQCIPSEVLVINRYKNSYNSKKEDKQRN